MLAPDPLHPEVRDVPVRQVYGVTCIIILRMMTSVMVVLITMVVITVRLLMVANTIDVAKCIQR